jgi:protein-disulfide isomerase
MIRGIRQSLDDNPDIPAAMAKMTTNPDQMAAGDMVIRMIAANAPALFRDAEDPVARGRSNRGDGPALVMFYDYGCPYCKMEHVVLTGARLVYPELTIIFKPIAILGPASDLAARFALAATLQNRFGAFHELAMADKTEEGKLTEAHLLELAAQAGLDVKRLVRDAKTPAIAAHLARNQALAQALTIAGTPGLVMPPAGPVAPAGPVPAPGPANTVPMPGGGAFISTGFVNEPLLLMRIALYSRVAAAGAAQ